MNKRRRGPRNLIDFDGGTDDRALASAKASRGNRIIRQDGSGLLWGGFLRGGNHGTIHDPAVDFSYYVRAMLSNRLRPDVIVYDRTGTPTHRLDAVTRKKKPLLGTERPIPIPPGATP